MILVVKIILIIIMMIIKVKFLVPSLSLVELHVNKTTSRIMFHLPRFFRQCPHVKVTWFLMDQNRLHLGEKERKNGSKKKIMIIIIIIMMVALLVAALWIRVINPLKNKINV